MSGIDRTTWEGPVVVIVSGLVIVVVVALTLVVLAHFAPDEEAISARTLVPKPRPVENLSLEQLGARQLDSDDDGDDLTAYDDPEPPRAA